jgi:hypothetical protein
MHLWLFVVISCSSILVPWCPYPLLVLECIGVSRTLPFLDFNSILLSYVKAQAQAFDACVSPPRVNNPILYNLAIRVFIDNEAHEWNRLFLCWARGWTALTTFVRSLNWVENFNKNVFFLILILVLYLITWNFILFSLFSSSPFSCEFYDFLHMFSIRIIFHSHMWPSQIDFTISIIVSNECLWDNCIVPSNRNNPMFNITLLKFSLNVWKHTIKNYSFTFFSNVYLYCFPHFLLLLVLRIKDQESLNCAKRLLGVAL